MISAIVFRKIQEKKLGACRILHLQGNSGIQSSDHFPEKL
jgi:hypothetical protein